MLHLCFQRLPIPPSAIPLDSGLRSRYRSLRATIVASHREPLALAVPARHVDQPHPKTMVLQFQASIQVVLFLSSHPPLILRKHKRATPSSRVSITRPKNVAQSVAERNCSSRDTTCNSPMFLHDNCVWRNFGHMCVGNARRSYNPRSDYSLIISQTTGTCKIKFGVKTALLMTGNTNRDSYGFLMRVIRFLCYLKWASVE